MLIDIRSREISQLRENSRQLMAALAEMEKIARTNDRILLTLHKIALLLIAKPRNWQAQVTSVLKKQFNLPHCQLLTFPSAQDTLARSAARLPLGGKGLDAPLPGSTPVTGAKRYFYLPLKQGQRIRGLLVFSSKKAGDFPDNEARDFMRRLGELLAAAL